MKIVGAAAFKTHCLRLLDEVAAGKGEIVVLKRGKPVARVLPVLPDGEVPQAGLVGTMIASDDLIDPPLPPEAWEAESGR